MPWSNEHKAHTRARIVEAAAAALREHGIANVGVADIMAAAGLTHGGFYAHFPSKEDLLAEAVARASEQSLEPLAASLGDVARDERLHAVIDTYLSPGHVAHAGAGCPVAAVGSEVARAGGRMHRNMARAIRERIDWLRTLLPPGRRAKARDEQAVGALACMVGGLILARAVDKKDSAALLEACRGFLHRALD